MSEFTLSLDISSLEITSQTIDTEGNIVFTVKSKCAKTTCHKCGKDATKAYGHSAIIDYRHTSILDTPVILKIKPIRYECKHCNDGTTTTEKYDWVAEGGKITKGLEKYILRCIINSTIQDVARKERISYKTIQHTLNQLINCKIDWDKHSDLDTIGIDEISNRKGRQDFIAIVSAKDKRGNLSILGVLDSRKKEDVLAFLESIPNHLRKTVNRVCTDMYDGFVNAATEVFGKQKVVVDRYHVAKLYRNALDALRTKEMKRLKNILPTEEYAQLEGMMWILRKKHECLSKEEKQKIDILYKHSPILKEAHVYALKLTHIFNTHHNRKSAIAKLDRWVSRVEQSELNCFSTFLKTLKKYKSSIANYFKSRATSGFVEGLNNKIKIIKRRCYGFFKTESLFQRLTVDLSGYRMLGL
jgi:transposase